MKRTGFIISLALLGFSASTLLAKYEQEQIQIETQLQNRIESILAKTLPPNSYLVTVKVEMEDIERQTSQSNSAKRSGNSLFGQNKYVLPGVPGKKEYGTTPDTAIEQSASTFSVETLVKHISLTILVAPDVTPDQIKNIREIITGSIPFNPLRGDEMEIHTSTLLKPVAGPATSGGRFSSVGVFLLDRNNAPVLMLVGAVFTILILFVAFLFGPMRAFLNRLLAVLPRVGEQAAYTVSNAPKNAAAAAAASGASPNGMNGNGSHNEEEEGIRPFHFIREDQLNKLPILFHALSPAQCALVLAYMPAAWASKVLGVLDQNVQTTIMQELSQAREVPPDVVTELEEHIKAKLPYLVGGSDWIQSVYQLTQPQTQRALLGTLNQQSPELAQALRRKTFFMEDMGVISAGALRLLLQEVSYPVAALALKDEKQEIRNALLNRLPVAMREILQQELDLAAEDKTSISEAKGKLMDIGRRLLTEGRIAFPQARAS